MTYRRPPRPDDPSRTFQEQIKRQPIPDRLWQALAAGSAAAPALPEGIADASANGRGAQGQAGADAQRNGVPVGWSRGFDMRGRHLRGRALRHVDGDYSDLVSAVIEQGVPLFDIATRTLRRHRSSKFQDNP